MEEKFDFGKSAKIKAIILALAITTIAGIGVSYAYFALSKDEAYFERSSLVVASADLRISFVDGDTINISDIYPGTTATKTFSVTNDTNYASYYDIKMQDVFGTFIEDELVYTLTSTNSGATKTETIMPNNDGLIAAKILIPANTTQTYTMNVTWKEKNEYQNYNLGATYTGKIQIISPYNYTGGTLKNIKLTERIMIDNTTAYPTNTSSKYVTSNTGIDYAKASDCGYSGYTTYEESVSFTSSANRYTGTDLAFYSNSGTFILTGTKASNQTFSESSIGKYTCYTIGSATCYASPFRAYKILEVSGTTATKVLTHVAKPNRSSWNGLGLYQTSTNTENNQPTYFFRGHVLNNYISFATYIWRIVRINEDGTIRIIRQTNYGNSKFNTSTNNAMYVGFKFGDTSDPYSNDNDSAIKTKLEEFYTTKIASYSDYFADAGFCNDRSTTSTGTTKYYGAYMRLVNYTDNKTPQFACPNALRDLFTLSGSSKGNGELNYPVGLITADEVYFSGALYGRISKSYLNNGAAFWTMTPSYNNTSNAYVFRMLQGGLPDYATATGSVNTRAVVNLKADTLVTGGSGTVNDPYTISR